MISGYTEHIRKGIDLGNDHYVKLEYKLPDGRIFGYPAGQKPDDPRALLVGLLEHHRHKNSPDKWCGGWVGFKNMPGADERSGHELIQEDPLTVAPSLSCGSCGMHGFIENGTYREV